MKEKKGEILVVLGCLLLITLTVSVAFFMARIEGEGKGIVIKSKELKITFTESNTLSGTNIEPGWNKISSFTVKNESDSTYKYNISIKDLVNTFVTTGYLQYKITSADGGYTMSDYMDIPKSSTAKDKTLAYSIEIASNATQTYTVEFRYQNTTEDQSADMGKTLSGTLYIEVGTDKPTIAERILDDNPTVSTRTDFSTTFTTTNTGTLYKATESIAGSTAKDVYYFAGNAKNNWVKFGGFYWKIIRTNHDGSVRMLYSGTSPDTTEGYIGTSEFNSTNNDPMHVGYMYGTSGSQANNRTNINNSTIKTYIDTWYSNNLSSYTKYISTEAVYCNDRNVASGTYSAAGSERFNYMASGRLATNKTPTYDCTTPEDAFSGSNAKAKLTYPIGLMTADEVSYAGGLAWTNNPSVWYYLNSTGSSITGSTWWWLLSPDSWDGGSAGSWYVRSSSGPGNLGSGYNVNYSGGVRPVISLKGDLIWKSGDGSSTSPYEVEDLPSTLAEKILENKTIVTTPRGGAYNTVFTEDTTGTLFQATESIAGAAAKTVYYFAGAPKDNWVKFAGFYWRIIRTNHDGSIRLLYAGTTTDTTNGYIGTSAFNSSYDSPKYVGYMYGTDGSLSESRTNTNDSTIKTYIDNWYSTNLSSYSKYISTEAVYCNDRQLDSGQTWSTSSSSSFNYITYTRLDWNGTGSNASPTYDCADSHDAFSASNTDAKLTYPIGLMTADEINIAGGLAYNNAPAYYYLNSAGGSITGRTLWWSLSPVDWNGGYSYVWFVYGSGRPGNLNSLGNVDDGLGVRPAISLKTCALWTSGNGAPETPYEISTTSGC